MEKIELKDLIKEVNSKANKNYTINFEGMITAQAKVENLELQEDDENIKITNKANNEFAIRLLKHQIMKVLKQNDGYTVVFDAPQNVSLKQIG